MRQIFICYRREESSGHAGRLYDRLRAHFGADHVFMDIEDIEPGVDYLELIDRTIAAVDILIVLIGPQWLAVLDPAGRRRLDDSDDLVRMEVSAALARHIKVIPVLVRGATMPHPSDLPPDLTGLARHNALEISDTRWDFDTERLVRAIDAASTDGGRPGQPEAAADHEESPSRRPVGASARLPTALAASGMLLVLVWGTLIPREWHNELWGIRVGVGVTALALASVGLWSRRWRWVLLAGIVGVAGFSLWLFQLLAQSHSVGDILSPSTDGFPNASSLLGALLVLTSGVTGGTSRNVRVTPLTR